MKEGDHSGLLIGITVIILVLVVVASGIFYIMADRDLESATYKAHFETLRHTMQMLLPWLVMANLIALIVILFLAVIFTHRISGPAYHLIRDLQKIGEGDLTVETVFRKRDRIRMVGQALTDAVSKLRATISEVKGDLNALSNAVKEDAEMKNKTDDIQKKLDKLRT